MTPLANVVAKIAPRKARSVTDEVRRMLRCYRWTTGYLIVVATILLALAASGR